MSKYADTSELRFGSVQNLYLELETLPLTELFRSHVLISKNIHKGTGSQRLFVLNNTNQGRYLSRKKMRMNEGVVDVSPKPYTCVALLLVVSFLSSEYSSYEYSARRLSTASRVFSQRGTIRFAGNVFLVNALEFTRIFNIV